jgi:hypothetical protein
VLRQLASPQFVLDGVYGNQASDRAATVQRRRDIADIGDITDRAGTIERARDDFAGILIVYKRVAEIVNARICRATRQRQRRLENTSYQARPSIAQQMIALLPL